MKQLLAELAEHVESEASIDDALVLARYYGNLCWSMGSVVYDSSDLERKLASRVIAERGLAARTDAQQKDALHVVSEPYLTGGHTRLMEKLADMHETTPDIMITRPTPRSVSDKVREHFSCLHDAASIPGEVERIRYMTNVMAGYQRIVLSIHPDDILSVIACILVKEIASVTVYLVNHADHTFTFGSAAADVYFELSSYGRQIDELKMIEGQKSFLGIPVKDASASSANCLATPACDGKMIFFSAGSDIKFKPREGQDIRPLISALLRRYSAAEFFVVGPNVWRDTWWWFIKLRFGARLKLMKVMPYDQYIEVIRQASFFVDSHPMPGGTAFAEQLLAGRKCIGLVSPYQGYSPAEKIKSANINSLFSMVDHYSVPSDLIAEVKKVNGYEYVRERYLGSLYHGRSYSNLMDEYCTWTGNVHFFGRGGAKGCVDISAQAYAGLFKMKPLMAISLFRNLHWVKKVKLILKLVLLGSKRLASRTTVAGGKL